MPLRDRNRLLEAGGFAHVYRNTPLEADEMRHIRGVLQFILDRHKPYAAVVLDRYSNCLMGNGVSDRMLAAVVDPSLITEHANLLRMVFHPLGARRSIVNWEEVSRHLFDRAEARARRCHRRQTAKSLLKELRGYMGTDGSRAPTTVTAGDLLLPIHPKVGDTELRLFSTIMTLGTPHDITLQELRIETFFPADAKSEEVWSALIAA